MVTSPPRKRGGMGQGESHREHACVTVACFDTASKLQIGKWKTQEEAQVGLEMGWQVVWDSECRYRKLDQRFETVCRRQLRMNPNLETEKGRHFQLYPISQPNFTACFYSANCCCLS